MMLKKTYIRDGDNQVIGSKITGFGAGQTIARDSEGSVIGRSSDIHQITRDGSGRIVSNNEADVDLLFRP
jgi:hypothetical protein